MSAWLTIVTQPVWASKLEGADLKRELAWTALHIIDWGQTLHIAKHPERFIERNSILGDHPSTGRVNTYMALMLGIHWAAAKFLVPKQHRKIFQQVTLGLTGGAVANNFRIGVRLDF